MAANATQNGFQFQTAAAISLLIDNLDDFKSIKNEGVEDIVICLLDESYVIAQAKSAHDDECSDNARQYFREASNSLNQASSELNCKQIIYVTNIHKMFGKDTIIDDFVCGETVPYNELDNKNKELVDDLVEEKLDYSKFAVHYLKYIGDDTKNKWIIQKIKDCFSERKRLSKLTARSVYNTWVLYLNTNASCKDTNTVCDREKITWGMIVDEINHVDDEIYRDSEEDYSEVINTYSDLLELLTSRFDIISRIYGDYSNYITDIVQDNPHEFAVSKWSDYKDIVDELDFPDSIKEQITKILIEKVLRKKKIIKDVKMEMRT